jgi:hypothetical protein
MGRMDEIRIMSFDREQLLRSEISPGERLLWNGAPRQGLQFRRSDLSMVLFSLL